MDGWIDEPKQQQQQQMNTRQFETVSEDMFIFHATKYSKVVFLNPDSLGPLKMQYRSDS